MPLRGGREGVNMKLDDQGRCCGRKPIHYLGPERPSKFCPRCDRDFDADTGHQVENWSWKPTKTGTFEKIQGVSVSKYTF